jgi:hypothetical protein
MKEENMLSHNKVMMMINLYPEITHESQSEISKRLMRMIMMTLTIVTLLKVFNL